jgi:hypothetical protein
VKTIRTTDPFTLQHAAEIMPEVDREMLDEISLAPASNAAVT